MEESRSAIVALIRKYKPLLIKKYARDNGLNKDQENYLYYVWDGLTVCKIILSGIFPDSKDIFSPNYCYCMKNVILGIQDAKVKDGVLTVLQLPQVFQVPELKRAAPTLKELFGDKFDAFKKELAKSMKVDQIDQPTWTRIAAGHTALANNEELTEEQENTTSDVSDAVVGTFWEEIAPHVVPTGADGSSTWDDTMLAIASIVNPKEESAPQQEQEVPATEMEPTASTEPAEPATNLPAQQPETNVASGNAFELIKSILDNVQSRVVTLQEDQSAIEAIQVQLDELRKRNATNQAAVLADLKALSMAMGQMTLPEIAEATADVVAEVL